jgi:ribosomal subunit interface protein
MEPRTTRIDLEFIGEHYPAPDGVKRVEAALHIPRKTFRAHAEADDVPTAIDRVADKLERQLRDHHGKRRASVHKSPLESAHLNAATADTEAEGETEGDR